MRRTPTDSTRRLLGAVAILVGVGVIVVPAHDTHAIPVTPFGVAFTTNDNGAIFTIGNNLVTCPASAPTCAGARAGTVTGANSSNNAYSMVNLDADNDPSTVNSSSSELLLPAGSTVLWAGAFWGARKTGDPRSLDTTRPLNQMSLRVPGAGAYQTITSTKTYGPTGGGDLAYQQFADITSIVQAAGNGSYWGANVAAGLGNDRYAGWSIAVVYRDPTQPLRNLTVFDGFSDIAVNSSEVITVSGFLAPLTGTVDARVGIMAYEGDRGATGDSAFLNATRLATAASPGTNFFNSSNDLDGRSVTTRTPADDDMFGFDISRVGVPGAIPNGATSATVTVSTTSERYYVGWVTTQINLYAPDFTTSRKTSTNLAGRTPAVPGDTIEYTLTYVNTGGDPATDSIATDPLPPNTTYVPGSLEILDGPNAGPKTDGAGDDQAEVTGGQVRARLGTGATGAAGGTIAPGATTTVRFLVITGDAAAGTTLRNRASLDYRAQTVNQPFTYVGNETADPVSAAADLRVTKSTTPNPVAAGGTATSTITVTNDGPSAATNVRIVDTLDAGVTPTVAAVAGGSCAVAAQVVTCTIASLGNGVSAIATITAAAAADTAIATFSNLATVTSDVTDPDGSDNTAGATVDVVQRADLSITKTVSNPNPPPGLPFTYTVTVTNNGPSQATGVTVNDTLDSRLTAIPVGPTSTAACKPSGQAIACAFGTLAPSQSVSGTFDVVLNEGVALGAVVPNSATVASQTPDPQTSNQAATVNITAAAPQADLQTTKTGPTTVVAGQAAAYSIDVVNAGPSTAANANLTDALPPGATVVSVSSSRGSCSAPPAAACALGSIPVGGTAHVTVNVTFDAGAALGPVTNTATASSATADPDLANNIGTAGTTLTGTSDISIVKTGSPLVVVAGGAVTYTLSVSNAGPSTAHDVTVTDFLPTEFDFGAATPGQGTCGAPAGGNVACDLGDIASGATAIVTVTMAVPGGFPGGDVTNSASVSTTNLDPDPSDNTADFTNTTSAAADLSLTKTTSPDPVVAGSPVTWTLTVTNDGPSDAAGVTLTDPLPAGLDPTAGSTTTNNAGCIVAATVTCALGTIASGSSVTVQVTAKLLPGGEASPRLVNVARVASSTLDPTDSNNVATIGSDVLIQTDLTVTKVMVDPSTFTPITADVRSGEVAAFLIVVTNAGPSTARDVQLLDHWDANWEGVTGPLCQFIQDDIECNVIDALPPGQQTGFVVFLYPFEVPGTYTNAVGVSTSSPETNTTNNSDDLPVDVLAPQLDLTLTKAVNGSIVAGAPFEYDLTLRNAGPSIGDVVTVTDTLPPGLTPQAATAAVAGIPEPAGTCDISGQLVTCTLPFVFPYDPVNSPDERVITITGSVDAAISGTTIANTATATATGEQTPLDNTATATTPIVRQANISLVKTTESATVAAGGNVVYNVAITNAGPSAATSAELTDLLPTGVTFDPDLSDATCTVAVVGDPVSCDLTTVAVGATVTVRIGGRIDPAYTTATLENTASFASDANAPVASNTLSTPVEVLADLAVTKTATGDAVPAGGQVEYTITVANDGPSTATNVSLDDPIPAGTTLASVVPTAPLACTTVPCAVGNLGPGETASVVLTLNVPADRTPGPLDNTATADSPTPDPNPGRRTATATVEVIRNADVSVQKVLRTDPVVAGQPVSYDLVVTNAGPSNAEDVTVTDAIPLGTTLVAGDLGGPACEQTDIDAVPTVSCVLPQLAVGATFTGTLTLATDASLTGSLSNTAVVGSQALDRNDAGNVSTAVGLVVQAVDPTVPSTDPPSEPTTVPAPVTPPAPPTTTPTTVPPPPDSLPATGIAIGGLGIAGGVLLLGGGLLRDAATGRRRRLRVRR